MMSTTPLQMLEYLRWYIQHLIHESGYLYDDVESNYPLSEDKWMLQTHGKFMKYVFFTLHVRELDLAMCVSPSANGSKMRSLWTNQMKS